MSAIDTFQYEVGKLIDAHQEKHFRDEGCYTDAVEDRIIDIWHKMKLPQVGESEIRELSVMEIDKAELRMREIMQSEEDMRYYDAFEFNYE